MGLTGSSGLDGGWAGGQWEQLLQQPSGSALAGKVLSVLSAVFTASSDSEDLSAVSSAAAAALAASRRRRRLCLDGPW